MVDINSKLLDTYLALIAKMGYENKLELISRLSLSLKENPRPSHDSFFNLFGSFDKNESAEDLIKNIKASRVFNRKIEGFE